MLLLLLWKYFTTFSSVSIVDFEQVYVSWVHLSFVTRLWKCLKGEVFHLEFYVRFCTNSLFIQIWLVPIYKLPVISYKKFHKNLGRKRKLIIGFVCPLETVFYQKNTHFGRQDSPHVYHWREEYLWRHWNTRHKRDRFVSKW